MKKQLIIIGFLYITVVCATVTPVFSQKDKKEDKKDNQKEEKKDKKEKKEKPKKQRMFESETQNNDMARQIKLEENIIDGSKFLMLENYEKALESFKKATDISPESSGAQIKVAESYFMLAKYRDALPYAQKALELDKNTKYIYFVLARTYTAMEQYKAAADTYEALIAKKLPNSMDEMGALYDIYVNNLGDNKKALLVCDEMEKISGIQENISRMRQRLFIEDKRFDLAIKDMQKLTTKFPFNYDYQLVLADYYFQNKEKDKAIQLLENIIKISPETAAKAQTELSEIYQMSGETGKANDNQELALRNPKGNPTEKALIFTDLLKNNLTDEKRNKLEVLLKENTVLHPENTEIFMVYGDLLAEKQDYFGAQQAFQKSISLENTRYEIWQKILNADVKLFDVKAQLKHAQAAQELFPNNVYFMTYEAFAYLDTYKYTDAQDVAKQAIKIIGNKDNPFGDYLEMILANIHYVNKEDKKAEEIYSKILKDSGELLFFKVKQAEALAKTGRKLEIGNKILQDAIQKEPQIEEHRYIYAFILYKQSKFEEAKNILEKDVPKTTNGKTLELLGDVYFRLNQQERAMEYWQKAQKFSYVGEFLDKKITQKKIIE